MKFSEMYPKDRFYAAEFKGKPVTLTFRDKDPVTSELLGKGGPSEKTLPVWHFSETPKKLPAVVTNGACARALFGDESDDWAGHKITLYPAPDASGMSDDGLCIRVKGSPELKAKLVFSAQIGRTKKTFTLVPTGTTAAPPANVDPVTGEIGDGDGDGNVDGDDIGFTDEAPHPEEAVSSTQRPQISDAVDEGGPYASAEEDAENGDIPGRGALFATDDPKRPASNSDKKRLSEALAHVDGAAVKQYRERFGGRGNSELTHGEAYEFKAWAVLEAGA